MKESTEPSVLGRTWQSAIAAKKQVPIVRVDETTVFAEIHTPCPLRGTGDVDACYRMMGYDRAFMERANAHFVVLRSQAEPGVSRCSVAIRHKNHAVDDLRHGSRPPIMTALELRSPKTPPRVPGLPWVGALFSMVDTVRFFSESRRYGDVVYAKLFGLDMFLAYSPAVAEHVLVKNQKNYRKDKFIQRTDRIFGDGLLLFERQSLTRASTTLQALAAP